jgi:hypothetical protein
MSDIARPIERQRLDRALVDAGRKADPATRVQIEAFEVMLRGRRAPARQTSLREEIEQLVMPEIVDPGIFNAGRSLDLLAHVVDVVLPRLGADEEISALAGAVLEEEIARRREIEERMKEADLS